MCENTYSHYNCAYGIAEKMDRKMHRYYCEEGNL